MKFEHKWKARPVDIGTLLVGWPSILYDLMRMLQRKEINKWHYKKMYSYLIRHSITFLILLLLKIGTSVHIYLPLTTKVLLAIITSHEGCQYKLIQPIVYTAIFFPFRQPTLLVMLEVLKSYWWEVWDFKI